MRILFLAPYVPSLVRVRPYQFIRHLAEQGHEVTLICLAGHGEEPAALQALRRWCREVVAVPRSTQHAALSALRALPSGRSLQVAYGESAALVSLARAYADRHDVVHVEHLRGSSYGAMLADYPLVLDAVDCISLLFERALRQSHSLAGRARALLDLARTRQAEARYGALFKQIVVTSHEDRWALHTLASPGVSQPQIDVVVNGVDLAAFQAGSHDTREPATLVFSGKMSYHANVTAALWLGRVIMPMIWKHRPDVHCQIVGREPTGVVQALAADPRIRVTGEVPAIAPLLRRATIAVVPLRYGVGVQNKVLEAMATATPVVATPQAARALDVSGREIVQATTADAFAHAVLTLLDDSPTRARLAEAGRSYVERCHDWRHSTQQLVDCYDRSVVLAERGIAC